MAMLILSSSCGTNNKPVTDAQKEKIKGEVKEVVNTYFKGAEEANADMILATYLDSPDFVFTYNGNSFSYKQCADMVKSAFGTLKNQKITVVDEKYAVLDNSTVMVTVNNKCLMNYKDGHCILQDPWISQILIKKIDNKWKVISGAESGIEHSVKNAETSKELNQVELIKVMVGSWKAEIAKDTFYLAQYKSFGNGIEGIIKIVTKGKKIMEGRALLGYDKNSDKLIETDLIEGQDIMLYGIWFTAKNTLTEIPWQDISHPENTPVKWKYEIKSPDLFVWNNVENNKTTFSYTFYREKK